MSLHGKIIATEAEMSVNVELSNLEIVSELDC